MERLFQSLQKIPQSGILKIILKKIFEKKLQKASKIPHNSCSNQYKFLKFHQTGVFLVLAIKFERTAKRENEEIRKQVAYQLIQKNYL